MSVGRKLNAVVLAALVGWLGGSGGDARAADAPSGAVAGWRAPVPAKGKGDKCVAPTDWMRRNHMAALKHKRDDTVHGGVRTKEFALKGCVECHAVEGADGKPVSVESPRHFCRTCHDYAAVSVDCFECHASKPGEAGGKSAAGPAGGAAVEEAAALARYVEGHGR